MIGATYHTAWARDAGRPVVPEAGLAPRFAKLDLAHDPILPAVPEGQPAPGAQATAQAAGASLAPILAETQRATLAAMRVTDAAAVVVASPGAEQGLSLAGLEEVAAALAGEAAARLRIRQDVVSAGPASISRAAPFRVFVSLPVRDGAAVIGAVLLSRTSASIDQAIWGKPLGAGRSRLGLALLAAGLALFTAYTGGRPIGAVAEQAKAVAAGGRAPAGRTRRSAVRMNCTPPSPQWPACWDAAPTISASSPPR